MGAALFAALPVLVKGYTFPPGDDVVWLNQHLTGWKQRYYGHLPAVLLGMTLYYYLTPVLTLAGVYVLMVRYGAWAVVLGWASLWLLCRTLLFDLHAGTFVGVIAFYGLGLAILRYQARWAEGKSHGWLPFGLSMTLLPFHSFTGLVVGVSEAIWGSVARSKQALLLSSGMLGLGAFSAFFLSSSVGHLRGWLGYPVNTLFFAVEFDRFIIQYVGYGVLVYWFLALNVIVYAWQDGWRPKLDVAIAVLAAALPPLLFMTFSPWAINGDRTAKLVVGISVLLATVGIAAGLRHLGNWRMNWVSGGVIAGCFALATPQIISYWLQSGSYR